MDIDDRMPILGKSRSKVKGQGKKSTANFGSLPNVVERQVSYSMRVEWRMAHSQRETFIPHLELGM